MAKFKVGDIVKPNEKADRHYGPTNRNCVATGRVKRVWGDPNYFDLEVIAWAPGYTYCLSNNLFRGLRTECFDLVEPEEELHVTRKGKTTHVVLKKDGKIVKRSQADCDPRDEFDFETGARLAIDRVFGKEEAEKKEQTYKFNIGDPVVVKDKKEAFPFFKDFVEQYDKDTQLLFAYGHCPKQGGSYTVIKRGFHPETKAPLYLIQPSSNALSSGELYLIGERGLVSLYDCCKYL